MKLLNSDNMLKLTSVIIAIALWFYVVQVQSPDIEKTFKGVPVVFTQKASLEEKGLILLNDKDRTIDVKLKGKRKHMVDVSQENLTVLADVSAIEEPGTHTVYTSIVLPYGNLEVLNKNPSSLVVEVDNLVSETFDVEVRTDGKPKDNYVTGNITATPDKVKITGAKSILDGIHNAVATININNEDSDVATVTYPRAFGSNDKEIDSSYIKFDTEEIRVRCEILKTKSVSVVPVLADELKSGEVEYTPDKSSLSDIKVKGAANIIDALSSVKTKPITLEDIDSSDNATVELELPDGVSSIDGDSFIIRLTKK